MLNTIFWANTASSGGAQLYNVSSSAVISTSVVQDGCPAGGICTNLITANPNLGSLGDHGGATQTIPLLPGSSAIDTAFQANCPTIDQRGVVRPQGLYCDIGAFEYDPAPAVSSIARLDPNPTNFASVEFSITFSEDVTGLSAADFSLFTTGSISGANVSGVSGSGAVYTVEVSTGAGSGTLRLDVPLTATVTDLVGNPLADLPFTSGEAYTLDKSSPAVLSSLRFDPNPTNLASVDFIVTFSEAVTGLSAADFSLFTAGSISAASVTGVSGSGAIYTVEVSTGTGSGTLRLDVPLTAAVTDPAGNPLAGLPYTGGEAYTVDKAAPAVVSSLRHDPNPTNDAEVDFIVTFSEAVTGLSAADFSLFTTGSISAASVTGVSGSGATYTVEVSTGTGSGTLRLDVPLTAAVTDPAGNPLAGLPYTGGEAYTLDKAPPAVVSSLRLDPNPTNLASVGFTVTFSEPVTGVSLSDFSLTTEGISGAAVTGVSGAGSVYIVTVSTGTGGGTLRLDVTDDDSILDAISNPLGGTGAGDGNFSGGEAYDVRITQIYLPLILRN